MSIRKILKRTCSVLMVVMLAMTTVVVDPGHVFADPGIYYV